MKQIHIGQLIEQRLKEIGMKKAVFAGRIHLKPQSIRQLLRRTSINTEQLQKISVALDYDFFQHYTTTQQSSASESKARSNGISVVIPVNDEVRQQRILQILQSEIK